MLASLLLPLALLALPAAARSPLAVYEIDLDLAPEDRYAGLFDLPNTDFNATVWRFFDEYFAPHPHLTDLLYKMVDKRGPEVDEMQREIQGMADLSKLPVKFVQGIQTLYELQTMMVPIVNFTGTPEQPFPAAADYPADWVPEGYEALLDMPFRGPGCTGIIAVDSTDGSVNHARNLDFSPVDIMGNLVYDARFTRGGEEVFRSQMIAGYAMVITGAKFGDDGFAIERNTRYTDHKGGNREMIENVLGGRELNGWVLRKTLEEETTYESAVERIATSNYASTEYAIVSGVRKGTILAKDPEGVAHTQTLGQPNFEERDDYIIITNFDYFWGDVREWFDPTGGNGAFHPRRIAAQKQLNATDVLTPEALFDTINNEGVFADTIFQAVINVEKGTWDVSQPELPV
ncbi:hypothetical protein TeGR_g13407 [Tetraparma gracilis]|uniref:ceramidase n=1 Tax=Tetraparma gracilis TaxID=2962635 RepID=A0ABQ6M550_9STRA|nr:hypothetical protein TeGR_g13407 [Tetraparma gracilis]